MLQGVYKAAGFVAVIYLAVFFALASGLVNSIIEGRNLKTFIVASRSVQTIGETVVMTMILFMGMGGVFLLYQAGKSQGVKAQQGLLVGGFGVLGVAMLIGYYLVSAKL
jgi:hypothetical protein